MGFNKIDCPKLLLCYCIVAVSTHFLTANPTKAGDGTLRILEGSHALHEEFSKAFNLGDKKEEQIGDARIGVLYARQVHRFVGTAD